MIKITANQVSTSGTSNGQILTSNGTVAYWTTGGTGYTGSIGTGYAGSAGTGYAGSLGYVGSIGYTGSGASGGGGFSNGQSISVANLAITGSLTANGSVGTSGQALVSTGTGVQWGALSPGYNYSSQFNGSSYLRLSNSAFAFVGNNFTAEAWVYLKAMPTTDNWTGGTWSQTFVVAECGTASLADGCAFVIAQTRLIFMSNDAQYVSSSHGMTTNTWYHLAYVRNGNTIYFYVNGVSVGSVAFSGNIGTGAFSFIGSETGEGAYLNGFISNLRLVNGTAVYTSAFTPPTSPLSAITNTSLLTCNAITPTNDSSTNNLAITNNGNITTTATLSPFTSTTVSIPTAALTAVRQQFTGDGSTTSFSVAGGYTANAISVFVNGVLLRNGTEVTVTNGSTVVFAIAPLSGALIDVIGTVPTTYSSITPVSYSTQFNGSSQYLTVPANAAFQMTADFTYECFAYFSSFSTTPVFFDQWVNTTTGAGNFQAYCTTAGVLTFVYDGSSSFTCGTLSTNTWYHIAATRSGSSIKVFVNGVQAGSVTFAGTVGRSDITFWFGAQRSGGPIDYINGYFSNVRVVKGLAVYTNNFTVPSSPLAITQSASGAFIQAITGTQTSLLTCNAPTIIDGSTNAFTITNNGSAPVSTAIVPTFTNVTINVPTPYYSANYLIVGGGGGASGDLGGGGGAGGLIAGSSTLIVGTTYSITVGSGGSGGTAARPSTGVSSGGFSSFNGLTSIGGGYGTGYPNSNINTTAGSGGSGGGGGAAQGTGWSSSGGSGTSGQGNAGGSGTYSPYNGGGGGGAGAVGSNPGSTGGGNGGAGLASSITGSSVYYAGGGGGGSDSSGGATVQSSGGLGGGGAGGLSGSGIAGTLNTGGGGGGGAYATTPRAGGAGGSGVVILSIPTANYTGTKTGSPTVTTNGIYTVLTFTASGSYTA